MTEDTKLPNIMPDDEDYNQYLGDETPYQNLNCDIQFANDIIDYFETWCRTHLDDLELMKAINVVRRKLPATLQDWQEWAATIYPEGRRIDAS